MTLEFVDRDFIDSHASRVAENIWIGDTHAVDLIIAAHAKVDIKHSSEWLKFAAVFDASGSECNGTSRAIALSAAGVSYATQWDPMTGIIMDDPYHKGIFKVMISDVIDHPRDGSELNVIYGKSLIPYESPEAAEKMLRQSFLLPAHDVLPVKCLHTGTYLGMVQNRLVGIGHAALPYLMIAQLIRANRMIQRMVDQVKQSSSRAKSKRWRILVNCRAGVNRSAACIAMHLMNRSINPYTYGRALASLITANARREIDVLRNDIYRMIIAASNTFVPHIFDRIAKMVYRDDRSKEYLDCIQRHIPEVDMDPSVPLKTRNMLRDASYSFIRWDMAENLPMEPHIEESKLEAIRMSRPYCVVFDSSSQSTDTIITTTRIFKSGLWFVAMAHASCMFDIASTISNCADSLTVFDVALKIMTEKCIGDGTIIFGNTKEYISLNRTTNQLGKGIMLSDTGSITWHGLGVCNRETEVVTGNRDKVLVVTESNMWNKLLSTRVSLDTIAEEIHSIVISACGNAKMIISGLTGIKCPKVAIAVIVFV